MGPNNASGVVWALGEPFFLFVNYFTNLSHRWCEWPFYNQRWPPPLTPERRAVRDFTVTPTPRVEITSYSVLPCLISTLTSMVVSSMLLATGATNSCWLDLYGNNGTEEQPQEENYTQQPPVPEAPTESPPSASIPAEQASSKLSNIETIQPNGMTPQVPSSNSALSSQYIQQQAPQKIPTYEEPQPSEYREPK